MRFFIMIVITLFFFSQNSYGSINELTQNKKQTINELVEITVTLKSNEEFSMIILNLMTQLITGTKSNLPENTISIPEEEAKFIVKKQITENNGFLGRIYPIYNKHFTHQELKTLLYFYKKPLGKKIIEKMLIISFENMLAGHLWKRELVQIIKKQLNEKFKKEGIDLNLDDKMELNDEKFVNDGLKKRKGIEI